MLRRCDGTDPNLTQVIPASDLTPAMTVSPWDRLPAFGGRGSKDSYRVINCDCGAIFDDVDQLVTWPHEPV